MRNRRVALALALLLLGAVSAFVTFFFVEAPSLSDAPRKSIGQVVAESSASSKELRGHATVPGATEAQKDVLRQHLDATLTERANRIAENRRDWLMLKGLTPTVPAPDRIAALKLAAAIPVASTPIIVGVPTLAAAGGGVSAATAVVPLTAAGIGTTVGLAAATDPPPRAVSPD